MSKIDLEPLVKLYTESIPGKLSDKLSDFFTPETEDKRSRKQPDLLLSPTKKEDAIDNITPPNPEDATTCTMFFMTMIGTYWSC